MKSNRMFALALSVLGATAVLSQLSHAQNLFTNGIILSYDEKTPYITNGRTHAALNVQPDGSLTGQRQFAKWEGGGPNKKMLDAVSRDGALNQDWIIGIQTIAQGYNGRAT
jgi:hypothetical protein